MAFYVLCGIDERRSGLLQYIAVHAMSAGSGWIAASKYSTGSVVQQGYFGVKLPLGYSW